MKDEPNKYLHILIYAAIIGMIAIFLNISYYENYANHNAFKEGEEMGRSVFESKKK